MSATFLRRFPKKLGHIKKMETKDDFCRTFSVHIDGHFNTQIHYISARNFLHLLFGHFKKRTAVWQPDFLGNQKNFRPLFVFWPIFRPSGNHCPGVFYCFV